MERAEWVYFDSLFEPSGNVGRCVAPSAVVFSTSLALRPNRGTLPPVIRLDSVSKQHGSQILFLDASMSAFKGEKVGLVGPNGSGKSTIFRMITKEEAPDGGAVAIDRNMTIGYFSQDVGEMAGRTVVEETMAGAGAVSEAAHELHELELAMADPARADELDALIDRFGHAQARFDQLGGYALESRAREILAGLGFHAESVDQDVAKLSGGWKMRVALARILLMSPDALLLDEPTNHLDIESIIWLEQFLRDFDGALIMTSHDREFMNRLVTKIVEIEGGDLISYTGNYDFYEQQRAQADLQKEAQYARQQAMLAKEEAFIARFKARASHAAQVQSRVKKVEKIEKVEPPKRRKKVEFDFRAPPRSGDDVAKLQGVNKAYGKRTIYSSFDLLIRRRERWCVMGVNGAGKSTLLKLIAGETQPDTGAVSLGGSVKLGYFAQHSMEMLNPDLTVFETLQTAFNNASVGSLQDASGCVRLLRRGRRQALPRAVGRRKSAGGAGADAVRSAELLGPGRADQPLGPGHQAAADGSAREFRGYAAVRFARPRVPTSPEQPRVGVGHNRGARLHGRICRVRRGIRARSSRR